MATNVLMLPWFPAFVTFECCRLMQTTSEDKFCSLLLNRKLYLIFYPKLLSVFCTTLCCLLLEKLLKHDKDRAFQLNRSVVGADAISAESCMKEMMNFAPIGRDKSYENSVFQTVWKKQTPSNFYFTN